MYLFICYFRFQYYLLCLTWDHPFKHLLSHDTTVLKITHLWMFVNWCSALCCFFCMQGGFIRNLYQGGCCVWTGEIFMTQALDSFTPIFSVLEVSHTLVPKARLWDSQETISEDNFVNSAQVPWFKFFIALLQ